MAYSNNSKTLWDLLFIELADPRTNDWFLIKSPVPGLTIIGSYLYFVNAWGPRYMRDRKPYQLTNTLIVYNFLQVLVNIYIFHEALDAGWLRDYSWKCEPVDFSRTPKAMRAARGVYFYFIIKLVELLDTVFFVLRKKNRQITFLHVYHHTVMPMISWGATKYYPGGHGTFVGLLNSFVHIIMYTYYMLAAMGPQYQKYLWWKKYITTMQMVQFLLVFLHDCQLLFYDCGFPWWAVYFTLPNAIFFIVLFGNFYKSNYVKNKKIENQKKGLRNENGHSINEIKNGDVKHIDNSEKNKEE